MCGEREEIKWKEGETRVEQLNTKKRIRETEGDCWRNGPKNVVNE